jgi:hypothetical protein
MSETPSSASRPVGAGGVDDEWDVDQEWLEVCARLVPDEDGPLGFDDPRFYDEDLLAARGPVSEWDMVLLASIDPASLHRDGRLDYLRRVEALKGLLASLETRAIVAVAGTEIADSVADRHVAMEFAQLRRVGEGAAATGIATARALKVEFPGFLAALATGEVSEWHCRILVTETANVTDSDTVAALQARLLPKATRTTPTQFRREVRRAVADLDAAREAARHARARGTRYVTCRPLEDGLGYLGVVTDWPTISAMHAAVAADGRALQLERGGAAAARAGDENAVADACRADALAARVLGTAAADGSLSWERQEASVSLTLVIDLDTLRGEADRHALLDGEPIPAAIAREYADVARTWRRAVTDPVTGHLLDYGREQYLPDRLRDYVLARDLCRAPGCTTRASSRLEMDHASPYPQGPSSAANCGGLCRAHHQLKTSGLAHVESSAADGSGIWATRWGQRVTIAPRPFLHDPADHAHDADPPAAAEPRRPDDPSPF